MPSSRVLSSSPLLSLQMDREQASQESRPVRIGQAAPGYEHRGCCAGPQVALLQNHQLPPLDRKLQGLFLRTDDRKSGEPDSCPACVRPGSKGHPARFHSKGGATSIRGNSAPHLPVDSGTKRTEQRMW